jgi:hypothetical protein
VGPAVDRVWFLTWHTYGTWLPGSEQGFVGETRDADDNKLVRTEAGTPYAADMPGLQGYVQKNLKGPPILLSKTQADCLFDQLQETAQARQWTLLGISISPSHGHLLVGVSGDPNPEKILGDFKAWGTRALNKQWGQPASDTWWTQGGSKRKKDGAEAIAPSLRYIRDQKGAWIIWIKEDSLPGEEKASLG